MKRIFAAIFVLLFAAGDAAAWGVRYPPSRWLTDDDRRPIASPNGTGAPFAPREVPSEEARSVEMLFELTARVTELPASYLPGGLIDAQNVNDFDEAPDSTWFTNRIGRRSLSAAEIAAGPGLPALSPTGPLKLFCFGRGAVSAWFAVSDSKGGDYFVILDDPAMPEMATGAGMITGRALFAAGYNVAPTGLLSLDLKRLELTDASTFRDESGSVRKATGADLAELLGAFGRGKGRGAARALVTQKPDGAYLGPFSFSGKRRNDGNDRIQHQQRRELRGLSLFAAWLDDRLAVDSRTADIFVPAGEGELGYVVHYLFGFEGSLGNFETSAAGIDAYVHPSAKLAPVVMGLPNVTLYTKRQMPDGKAKPWPFDVANFDPARWNTASPNVAFSSRVERDGLWAAFILSEFGDGEIEALVGSAKFSDARLSRHIAEVLRGRRDKLLSYWLTKQSPLADFDVGRCGDGYRVIFSDIAVLSGLRGAAGSTYIWRLKTLNGKATLAGPLSSAEDGVVIDGHALSRMLTGRLHDLEISAKRPGEEWPMTPVHLLVRKDASGALEIAGITRRSGR